jgi:tetratricopeptide (TPR) repeat protein
MLLEGMTNLKDEKIIYTAKALNVFEKVRSKNIELSLEELRIVRSLAMLRNDLALIAQMNQEISPLSMGHEIAEDIIALFYQSCMEENHAIAYEMWKKLLKNRDIDRKTKENAAPFGFKLCFFYKDYQGLDQAFENIRDKKSFFNLNEQYIYLAYEAYTTLGCYEKLFEIMKRFGRKDSVTELALVASLSELQGKYQEAFEVLERIAVLSPESASYEVLIAFCQRAEKEVRVKRQKEFYKKRIKTYKALLSPSGSAEGDVEAKKKPTPQSVSRAVRRLIAQKYMTSARDLWARMPEGASPELRALQDEMGVHYKACSVAFEAITGGEASLTVSDMYGHVEKMEKILKLVAAEKEKVRLANKRLCERENSSVKTPVLFLQAPPVNLRKEVLEGHGLSQKREKPENVEDDAPIFKIVMPQDDTPYDITWQWTPKAQKQKDSLSVEAQAKLDTFMVEVTRNPWSVRRDGSLALGEPRFVTGSLFGQNTYERDMDAYNRFIYNVTATGPKSARVMILGVQGHL